MKSIRAYKSLDGKLFNTKEECEDYEASTIWKEIIDKFISSDLCSYSGTAQKSIVYKTILEWEKFKGREKFSHLKYKRNKRKSQPKTE